MIERLKKAISIAVLFVFGAAFTGALAYWTVRRSNPVRSS
jgi:hypothetical protein